MPQPENIQSENSGNYNNWVQFQHSFVDRVVPEVEPYPRTKLQGNELFDSNNLPILENVKEHLRKEGTLLDSDVISICERAANLFREDPNVVTVSGPVNICGDIHGQYYDLLNIFENCGDVTPQKKYLFLGDYVDRGMFSTQVLIYLLCIKIRYPTQLIMLRGNHECRQMSAYFNFQKECLVKYSIDTYEAFCDFFQTLPLCAVVDNHFFCVHGGLSPHVKTVEDIQQINRFVEPQDRGAMCDLLWADPADFSHDFSDNLQRGCSVYFGFAAAKNFLDRNKFVSIIRAHEAQEQGYKTHKQHPKLHFPTVITLFSAPNYMDTYKNKGAVLMVSQQKVKFKQLNHVSHPYWLPSFLDVFSWSIPFAAESVIHILLTLLKRSEGFERTVQERNMWRQKVIAYTKLAAHVSQISKTNTEMAEIGPIADSHNFDSSEITNGNFTDVANADRINEMHPNHHVQNLNNLPNSPYEVNTEEQPDEIDFNSTD
eukprot:TRINITY_DN2747_c0_g2_i1.p1 TRINITY_DN2747_c0_g2~~TRINITY_DN2747_c0_g2_i1.p1  ORF type:complete len:485 (+),score=127.26 TRINITY_DN2747_c0_g2_i1:77-1531(+)